MLFAEEVETAAEDHFDEQVVGAMRSADAYAEIELPIGVEIEIDARDELLLLLTDGIEACDGSVRRIVFEAARDFFGEVVADFHAGLED